MQDVAPILVENCIACHNPRKSESKYVMTTFAQLAKGGQQGEGITLEPGEPDESHLVELIRPDGEPRMPYKQDPLPAEKIAIIERWVTEGAKYDGAAPTRTGRSSSARPRAVSDPRGLPRRPCRSRRWRSAPTARPSPPRAITRSRSGRRPTATLDRRLRGLAERIYDIAYSPDGKWLATASGDPGQFGVAKLWSPSPAAAASRSATWSRPRTSSSPSPSAPTARSSPPPAPTATIRIWEVETGKLLAQIEDHADWIFDIAFSPDGKRLASASRDKTSKVFDVEKKESLVTFPGHAQTVYTVAFTPDGKTVATGGEDNPIRVWNPDDDGKQVRQIGGFGGPVFRSATRPTARPWSPAAPTRRSTSSTPPGPPCAPCQGHTRLDLLARDLPRRQDPRLGELGRRGPALEPRRRQADPHHHRRPGLQAGGDHESGRTLSPADGKVPEEEEGRNHEKHEIYTNKRPGKSPGWPV